MRWVVLLLVTVSSLAAKRADACSPCMDSLNLISTSRRAGLVVVARRISEEYVDRESTACFATFEIQKVLKGYPERNTIEVAVAEFCGSHIRTERGESVLLFLESRVGRYFAVNEGCAVQSLPITDGRVQLADISLPPDVLGVELGFHAIDRPRPKRIPPDRSVRGSLGRGRRWGMPRVRGGSRHSPNEGRSVAS